MQETASTRRHGESKEGLSAATIVNRKSKEIDHHNQRRKKVFAGDLNLNDYHSIDPTPSSMSSIQPGPIEYGSPIIPYIPNPSPPVQPQPGDLP